MELRYDSYYERDIPYKCSLSELLEEIKKTWLTAEFFFAWLRNESNSIRFKIGDDDSIWEYKPSPERSHCDPLCEQDTLHENHWYHSYKITLMNDEGYEREWYCMDLISCIRENYVKVWHLVHGTNSMVQVL